MDRAEQLCRAAQTGDREAASELVALSYERVFAYFRRLCGHEEDAADLTQKTFRKVWESLATYAGRSAFNTWIHSIAHHVYVDWRRLKPAPLSQTDEWWRSQVSDDAGPFEVAARRDLATQVYSLVDKLDEDARETVHLHYYQGLTLEQTAETLAIATSTVKYRLRRATDFLRQHIDQATRTSK